MRKLLTLGIVLILSLFAAACAGESGGGTAADPVVPEPLPEPKTYVVRFYSEAEEFLLQDVSEDTPILRPSDPVRKGYRFDGWFLEETFATGFDFENKINGNLTLYAKWSCLHERRLETVLQSPTCGEEGLAKILCSDCGDLLEERTLAKLPHAFENWSATSPATCTKEGLETLCCSVCGESGETRPIPVTSHDYASWKKLSDSTCAVHGIESLRCSVCGSDSGQTRELPLAKHTFTLWNVLSESTCAAHGSESLDCSVCRVQSGETRPIDLAEHSYGDWTVSTPADCQSYGEERSVCFVCADTLTRPTAELAPHRFEDRWIVVKEPKCDEPGQRQISCTLCGALGSQKTDIPPLDHLLEKWVVVTPPACMVPGRERIACSVCNSFGAQTRPIPALGHSFVWSTKSEPTCTDDGEKTAVCQTCGETDSKPILALGHSFVQIRTEPACETEGYLKNVCATCGHFDILETISPTGHSYGEPVITPATCLSSGVSVRECAACGKPTRETLPLDPANHAREAAACGHFECCSPIKEHGAAECGVSGHYDCDGISHMPAECGVTGHSVCDGKAHGECNVKDVTEAFQTASGTLLSAYYGKPMIYTPGREDCKKFFVKIPLLAGETVVIGDSVFGGESYMIHTVNGAGGEINLPAWFSEDGWVYLNPLFLSLLADSDGTVVVSGLSELKLKVRSAGKNLLPTELSSVYEDGSLRDFSRISDREYLFVRDHANSFPSFLLSGENFTLGEGELGFLMTKIGGEVRYTLAGSANGSFFLPLRRNHPWFFEDSETDVQAVFGFGGERAEFRVALQEKIPDPVCQIEQPSFSQDSGMLSFRILAFGKTVTANQVAFLWDLSADPRKKFVLDISVDTYSGTVDNCEPLFDSGSVFCLGLQGVYFCRITARYVVSAERGETGWTVAESRDVSAEFYIY